MTRAEERRERYNNNIGELERIEFIDNTGNETVRRTITLTEALEYISESELELGIANKWTLIVADDEISTIRLIWKEYELEDIHNWLIQKNRVYQLRIQEEEMEILTLKNILKDGGKKNAMRGEITEEDIQFKITLLERSLSFVRGMAHHNIEIAEELFGEFQEDTAKPETIVIGPIYDDDDNPTYYVDGRRVTEAQLAQMNI